MNEYEIGDRIIVNWCGFRFNGLVHEVLNDFKYLIDFNRDINPPFKVHRSGRYYIVHEHSLITDLTFYNRRDKDLEKLLAD